METRDSSNQFADEQLKLESIAQEDGEMLADSGFFAEGRRVLGAEREQRIHDHVQWEVARYHQQRISELKEYYVEWDRVTENIVESFRRELDNSEKEEQIHQFLAQNKVLLVEHLGGGHGRYVLSKPKLGAEYVPDFLLAEDSSIGIEWHAVELESPTAELFTKAGEARAGLHHAIQQIIDWREWLTQNVAYARRPVSESGLGLLGIDGNVPATILMGRRRDEMPARFNAFRRQMKQPQDIEIHTYDWLLDRLEGKARALATRRKS